MGVKRESLFWMFVRQMIILAVEVFFGSLLLVFFFERGIDTGVILPANYAEKIIDENREALSKGFDEAKLPTGATYVILDETGQQIAGNMAQSKQKNITKILQGESYYGSGKYLVFPYEDKTTCVVYCEVKARFADEGWHRVIPRLEETLLVGYVLFLAALVAGRAFHMKKKISRELHPLFLQIEQVKQRELEEKPAEEAHSKIKEIEEVMVALSEMKSALIASLKTEWQKEQSRRDHICALAHDIKTPLTVIKGNAELLQESAWEEEDVKLLQGILTNESRMETYLGLLMEENIQTEKEKIPFKEFLVELEERCLELCHASRFSLQFEREGEWEDVVAEADKSRLLRAILNLVKNAMEHGRAAEQGSLEKEGNPAKQGKVAEQEGNAVGEIRVSAVRHLTDDRECVSISVEDFGRGFSKEALKHATEQFYTEQKARAGEHFGLGLSFANQVAQECGGTLQIRNKEAGGAVVTFIMEVVENSL